MKTLSLDIRTDLDFSLDISGAFQISEVHAISNLTKTFLDPIFPTRDDIVLARNTELRVDDFVTLPTLDIIHPEILGSSFWQKKFPNFSLRKATINLVPKLDIPLDSLDIRTSKPIYSERKYSDLFARKLPLSYATRRHARKFFSFSKNFVSTHKKRIIWIFVSIFLLIFPTIFFIKFSLENGMKTLLSLRDAKNISEVKKKIHSAKNDFDRARFLFLPFSWIPNDSVDMLARSTASAQKTLSALHSLTETLPDNRENFSLKIVENGEESQFRGNSKDIFLTENIWIPLPSDWIAKNNSKIIALLDAIETSGKELSQVRGDNKYATKIREAGQILVSISPAIEIYKNNSQEIISMLGQSEPQRYMIFNQNRDEIRANGGFPGSVITFTLQKGNILDYRTDDVYYYDWNLFPHKETPPPGIALLADNYGLRDVNYYPDFRDTLTKANNFVEKSGESTLTTAVAIHQGLIEEILAVVGGVKLDGIDEEFTHENFSLLMSFLVENKIAREKTPKDILFQFIPKFGEKIATSGKIDDVVETIASHWNRGEILIASRNDRTHDFLTSIQKPLPWYSPSKNWTYPVFTSISGNKSDRYIERFVETKIKPLGECRYETQVSLTLNHTYSRDDALKIEEYLSKFQIKDEKEQQKMRFIQGGGDNHSFIRLYMPKWTELSGSGAEISEEDTATIFSFSLKTPVGGSQNKTLTFLQNIPNCADYKGEIDIFRQPGLHHFITP